MPCDKCREWYGRKDEDPPCADCLPELHPKNREAHFIYSLVRQQVIVSMSGVVDINHLAVWEAIDRYKVHDPMRVFELVLKCFRRTMEDVRIKQEAKRGIR